MLLPHDELWSLHHAESEIWVEAIDVAIDDIVAIDVEWLIFKIHGDAVQDKGKVTCKTDL